MLMLQTAIQENNPVTAQESRVRRMYNIIPTRNVVDDSVNAPIGCRTTCLAQMDYIGIKRLMSAIIQLVLIVLKATNLVEGCCFV